MGSAGSPATQFVNAGRGPRTALEHGPATVTVSSAAAVPAQAVPAVRRHGSAHGAPARQAPAAGPSRNPTAGNGVCNGNCGASVSGPSGSSGSAGSGDSDGSDGSDGPGGSGGQPGGTGGGQVSSAVDQLGSTAGAVVTSAGQTAGTTVSSAGSAVGHSVAHILGPPPQQSLPGL
jgi:hypothetical protein